MRAGLYDAAMAAAKRRRPLTVAEMAKQGGRARWKDVPADQRSKIARKAVRARWAKARVKARRGH
jgi:hypothetical protein